MAAPVIASTSYTTREGTYTIEVREVGGTSSGDDLLLTQKPRVRASLRDGDLFGLVEHDIRLRVHDVGKTLSDKLRAGADLRLHIDGPMTFRGVVEKQQYARRMLTDGPVIDLKVSDGYDRLKGVDLSMSMLPVAEAVYELLAPLTQMPLRTNFDWNHKGQDDNWHSSRAVRMPMRDLQPATHFDALTTVVPLWNCQLYQKAGSWRLLHRLSTGSVVEYDGSSYSGANMEATLIVSSSDIVQSVNDNDVPTRRPSLASLSEVSSIREYPDHRTLQNGNFEDWTDGVDAKPIGWTVNGEVEQLPSTARLNSESDELSQQSTLPLVSFSQTENKITIEGRAEVEVPDSNEYYFQYALVSLLGHPDRDVRYIDQEGNITSSRSPWQQTFTVSGGGRKIVSFQNVVYPENPSAAMLPRLVLSFRPATGADVLWAEYDVARYDLSYRNVVVTQSTWSSNAEGTEDASFESPFGDWRRWSPRYGVLEYYTGSEWKSSDEQWLIGGTAYDFHETRVRELLRQRQSPIPGVDFHFDRWTLLGSRPVDFDGMTYLPVKADVQLGSGSSRLVAYAHLDEAPQHSITEYEELSSV